MHPQKEQSLHLSAQQQEKKTRRKLVEARKKNSLFWQIIYLLGSLQLALLLLATIGIACAVATFTESHFDSKVAHAVIYKAPWFLGWLALLCLNLFAVTLTRWPWQKKHFGFVLTHYGIITLLIGAAIGSKWGFEGNVTLQIKGNPVQKITTNKSILEVESPLTQNLYILPFDASVAHPSEKHPRYFSIPETPLQLVIDNWSERLEHRPSLLETKKEAAGWKSLIILLSSQALHQEQVVALSLEKETTALFDFFGLAKITLLPALKPIPHEVVAKPAFEPKREMMPSPPLQNGDGIPLIQPKAHKPWLRLVVEEKNNEVDYQLGRADVVEKKGTLSDSQILPLGWADWRLKLLAKSDHGVIVDKILPITSSQHLTSSVLGELSGFHAFLQNKEGDRGLSQWVASGEVTPLTLDSTLIRIGYGLELRSIPFSIELLHFQIPRDEGSDAPSDFRATVRFRNLRTGTSQEGLIRMNHPASFPGDLWASITGINYKFSQAEWNPSNLEETTLQVLYDPGWLLKWIGSLAICLGIAMMFYWNKEGGRRKAKGFKAM